MSKLLKIFLSSIIALILATPIAFGRNDGVKVTAEVDAPNVLVGDEFVYSVSIEGSDIPEDVKPRVSGLDGTGIQLQGITSSRQMLSGSSMTIIVNNKVIKNEKEGSEIVTFEYHLKAVAGGAYTIGPAIVDIGGASYTSRPVEVKVGDLPPPGGEVIPTADVFVHAEPSATDIYAGQTLSISYYFYFRETVNVKNLGDHELPELEGFIRRDFESPSSYNTSRVVLGDNQTYRRAYLGRLVVFPVRTGNLKIGSFKQQYAYGARAGRSLFMPSLRYAEDTARSAPVELSVKPLPYQDKPADFSGAIGSFKISAEVDKQTIRAGESMTLTLKITGSGNLQGTSDPELKLPDSVESYPPEKDENSYMGAEDLQWDNTYRYIISPGEPGNLSLGPVSFSYFNPSTGRYEKATSNTFNIEVLPGRELVSAVAPTSAKRIKTVGHDIRYIKPDASKLNSEKPLLLRTGWLVAIHFLPLMAIGGALAWRRRRDKLETDNAYARRMKSRERANKRVEKAKKAAGKSEDEFHRELYNAVGGFIADNCNLPDAGMGPSEFRRYLEGIGADSELPERVEKFLQTCQAVRYVPGAVGSDEKKLLDDAEETIKALARFFREGPRR